MRTLILLCLLAIQASALEVVSAGVSIQGNGFSIGASFNNGGCNEGRRVYTRQCAQQSNFLYAQPIYVQQVCQPTVVYLTQQSNFQQVIYVHQSNFAPPLVVYPGRCR